MKNKITSIADSVFDYAVEIRRNIHSNPELGNEEFKTTELIINELTGFGYHVDRPLNTGCIATLEHADSYIAFRADIDALPIKEETNLPYASQNDGYMHACGHDIHTAVLLACAKAFTENRDIFTKSLKLIFQPDEEGNGGAKRLVESGVMENVSEIYGMHIRPEIETGTIAVKYDKSYAASDMFTITVHGRSSHGAEPENGANTILASAEIIQKIKEFAPDGKDTETDSVASVCTFHSGTAGNIIPDKAELKGILRSFGEENRKIMREKLKSTLSAAEKYGCMAEVELIESYPGVVNHKEQTDKVKTNAEKFIGKCIIIDKPTYTTEDFGYYLFEKSGCFFHTGVGCEYPLHNSKLAPDETAMKNAISTYLSLLL